VADSDAVAVALCRGLRRGGNHAALGWVLGRDARGGTVGVADDDRRPGEARAGEVEAHSRRRGQGGPVRLGWFMVY